MDIKLLAAILMLGIFIYILLKNKMSVFNALVVVPVLFGVVHVIFTDATYKDLFQWLYEGLFYSTSPDGEIVTGVAPAAIMILFAILFFDLMLDVGLFDPVIKALVKIVKGDPLKVSLAAVIASCVVSFNGDTTTPVLILTATFIPIYKRLNMDLSHFAMLLIGPNAIMNMLPWGGPAVVVSTAINVPLHEMCNLLYSGMILGLVYCIWLGYHFGMKERKRLNYDPNNVQEAQDMLEEMVSKIDEDPEGIKRPQNIWINLAITVATLGVLMLGWAHGSIAFMLGTAVGLLVNYPSASESAERISANVKDAISPTLACIGAGVFSGILNGTGMSNSLAHGINSLIPESLGRYMTLIYALVTIVGILVMPQEAYYFGISSVISRVMEQYGVTRVQVGVASMMGLSYGMMSPMIPAIHLLVESTGTTFGQYQKNYIKYLSPIFIIFLITYIATGALPI